MSGPRKPRDLADYFPAMAAAEQLRQIADSLECNADAYPLIKWSLQLRQWNPEWEERKRPGIAVTAQDFGEAGA